MSSKRDAVIIPGRIGGPWTPWLTYPTEAAHRRGAQIHQVIWGEGLEDATAEWVVDQVRPKLAGLERPLLIGKSLGSHAASIASELGLPAIWVTPLIAPGQWYGDWVSAALRMATAPCLLIGGTADVSWDGKLARELSPHVFEADGADHALMVPGPVTESVRILAGMTQAVERFLDDVVWPA